MLAMAGLMIALQGASPALPPATDNQATPPVVRTVHQEEVRVAGTLRVRTGYTPSNRPDIEKRGFELAVFRRDGRTSGGEVCVFPDGGFPRSGQGQCFLLSARLIDHLQRPDEGDQRSLAPIDPFAQQFLRVLLSEGNHALGPLRILGYDTSLPIQVEVRLVSDLEA